MTTHKVPRTAALAVLFALALAVLAPVHAWAADVTSIITGVSRTGDPHLYVGQSYSLQMTYDPAGRDLAPGDVMCLALPDAFKGAAAPDLVDHATGEVLATGAASAGRVCWTFTALAAEGVETAGGASFTVTAVKAADQVAFGVDGQWPLSGVTVGVGAQDATYKAVKSESVVDGKPLQTWEVQLGAAIAAGTYTLTDEPGPCLTVTSSNPVTITHDGIRTRVTFEAEVTCVPAAGSFTNRVDGAGRVISGSREFSSQGWGGLVIPSQTPTASPTEPSPTESSSGTSTATPTASSSPPVEPSSSEPDPATASPSPTRLTGSPWATTKTYTPAASPTYAGNSPTVTTPAATTAPELAYTGLSSRGMVIVGVLLVVCGGLVLWLVWSGGKGARR